MGLSGRIQPRPDPGRGGETRRCVEEEEEEEEREVDEAEEQGEEEGEEEGSVPHWKSTK